MINFIVFIASALQVGLLIGIIWRFVELFFLGGLDLGLTIFILTLISILIVNIYALSSVFVDKISKV